MTNVDKAKFAFFEENIADNENDKGKYSWQAKPNSRWGFNNFERFWNDEVGRRFKRWVDGDEDVILLNRKCARFLIKHYDDTRGRGRISGLVNADDTNLVNQQFWTSHAGLPQQQVALTTPTVYPVGVMPFGFPFALNPMQIISLEGI